MRVISRSALKAAAEKHPRAAEELEVWYRRVRAASWADFTDLREDFRTADLYGNCTIFDIRRNEFRLITWVNYKRQSVFVRAFLTHADYDREGWKNDC